MQECTGVLFHRKRTKNNQKNVRKTCYWKLIFVICSYSTWRHENTRHIGMWPRKHARHVDTWAHKRTRHMTRKHTRHAGTWACKHARHVGTWAHKHARHVGTWARKHPRHVGTWARKAYNLTDSIKQSNLAADECKFNLVRYVMLDKHEARSMTHE